MKGKPVLNRISEPIKGVKVVYNGEWGKNVIYTIVKTFRQPQYFDLQNNDLLKFNGRVEFNAQNNQNKFVTIGKVTF